MFIDAKRYVSRLRQEGHVSPRCVWMLNINQLLPGVGREGFRNVNMALMTEGGTASQRVYKHNPPDGGSKQPIIDFRQAM